MLIVQNIRLSRVLRNTWQIDIIMIVSCTLAYFIRTVLIKHHFEIPAIIPTVLGTAIAFFVGFNNNQAYDRWWEARKVWGALVNDSRSWARCVISYISAHETDSHQKKIMVYRQLAFLYALKAKLRGAIDESYGKYLSQEDINEINAHSNVPNAILSLQSRDLEQLNKDNHIDGFRFMEMNQLLVKFSDEMGMSERIKNTIFPTSYNTLQKYLYGYLWCL